MCNHWCFSQVWLWAIDLKSVSNYQKLLQFGYSSGCLWVSVGRGGCTHPLHRLQSHLGRSLGQRGGGQPGCPGSSDHRGADCPDPPLAGFAGRPGPNRTKTGHHRNRVWFFKIENNAKLHIWINAPTHKQIQRGCIATGRATTTATASSSSNDATSSGCIANFDAGRICRATCSGSDGTDTSFAGSDTKYGFI